MLVIRKCLFFFALCVLLNYCASQRAVHHESFSARSETLLQIQAWQSKGKMGLTFFHEGKEKWVSASYEWQQQGDKFLIRFFGPLGMGEFTLEKQATYTVLTNHKGDQFFSESPEALFLEHAEVEIPWTLISFWLRGIPAPERAFSLKGFDERGLPLVLVQSEWTVSYLSWKEFNGLIMPNKLKITRDDMNATLVIRDWDMASQ